MLRQKNADLPNTIQIRKLHMIKIPSFLVSLMNFRRIDNGEKTLKNNISKLH